MFDLRCRLGFLFLLTLSLVYGQEIELHGVVKNQSNTPLPGAKITLKELNKSTQTNTTGAYRLKTLPQQDVTVIVSHMGYITQQKTIQRNTSSAITLDFILVEAQKNIDQVYVEGKSKAKKIKETGFNVNVIETKDFANTNSDINQVLNRSSGVNIREQGGLGSNYNFSLNGLSGNNIKFFLDGIPMESLGSGMTLNNIPVNIAERIEVYKGVVPAYLGSDALGGAVNIVTQKDKAKFVDASYSYGSFNTHRSALSTGYKDAKTGIRVNLNAYYNFSNNNYLMRSNPDAAIYITVPQKTKFDTIASARRFHDDYKSYMTQLELGVDGKKWADIAVVGLTYSRVDKQIQTGAHQEQVLGKVESNTSGFTPNFRYRKDRLWIDGLSLSAYMNMANSKTRIIDTSSYTTYTWLGTHTDDYFPNAGELSARKSIAHQKFDNYFLQGNLNYVIHTHHLVNFNYNLSSNQRKQYNEIDPYNDFFFKTNRIQQHIKGLNYQQFFLKRRLNNTFFVKHYTIIGKVQEKSAAASNATKRYLGYGAASNYAFTPNFGVKVSYEHAYRLPDFTELFGDGLSVVAAPELKPVNSDNYNLNFYTAFGKEDHRFNMDMGVFYRNAKDYILNRQFETTEGPRRRAYNQGGIKVQGADFEARYTYKGGLIRSVFNLSYYNATDREKYEKGTDRVKITYKNRTSNEPWLYGNFDLSTGIHNPWGRKDSHMRINYYLQYVNSYSTTWSKLAEKGTKDYIPAQYSHNVALTYSFAGNKYNITLDGRNLSNQITYDMFKLQKPGRSVSIKLRYVLTSN